MKKVETTPLPWHINDCKKYGIFIVDNCGNRICEMLGSFQYTSDKVIAEQAVVDAKYILHCIKIANTVIN